MQNEQASRTAPLIAASLVLLHRDPKYSGLISSTSADLCARVLEENSAQTRLFLKIVRQGWFQPIAKLIEFWEIDHPATQRQKVRALSKIGAERLHSVAVDLSTTDLDRQALIKSSLDPTQRTFWIAEGLLMYLQICAN
ncbi:MAG: class I SAM-dependent methyltransferase [Candidatus Udaeobacter sp.]|jgi:hypothetical protein